MNTFHLIAQRIEEARARPLHVFRPYTLTRAVNRGLRIVSASHLWRCSSQVIKPDTDSSPMSL